jgi:hypothetical protein
MSRALLIPALLVPLLLGVSGGHATEQTAILGRPEMVFDWSRDRCEDLDIPDIAASAFRDTSGRVQLYAGHFVWRRFVGPDLDHVTRDCRNLNPGVGTHDQDPSLFDDEAWLAGPYTTNGRDLYTLTHIEYHGDQHATQWCPSRNGGRCWYDGVGLAESHDGGDTWTRPSPPSQLVAAIPRKYEPDNAGFGMYSPTNLVRVARARFYYYAIVHQVGSSLPPGFEGTCVMRTRNLADPSSWRAWNGKTFSHQFLDPYRASVSPNHLCKPLPNVWQFNRIVYSTYLHRWIGTGMATPDGTAGGVLFYATSSDLVNWSPIVRLMDVELVGTFQCGDPDPVAYPALLDPKSSSRTFQTIGRRAYLYYTQFNYANCHMTLDRDLVRVPVEID